MGTIWKVKDFAVTTMVNFYRNEIYGKPDVIGVIRTNRIQWISHVQRFVKSVVPTFMLCSAVQTKT